MVAGQRNIRRRGITLVECLLAVSILAGTVLAATYTVVAGHQHSMYADRASRATRLARDLLEEIASKSYLDPDEPPIFGAESSESKRDRYDDVDDYNGLSEHAGVLRDSAGNAYETEDQLFSRSVTVRQESVTLPGFGTAIAGVTVTVSIEHQNGERWQFQRFIPEPIAP